MKEQINTITYKRNKLVDMLLDNKISQSIFDEKDLQIKNEITNLEFELKNLQKNNTFETIEHTKKYFDTFVDFKKQYFSLDKEGKRELLFNLLLNIT